MIRSSSPSSVLTLSCIFCRAYNSYIRECNGRSRISTSFKCSISSYSTTNYESSNRTISISCVTVTCITLSRSSWTSSSRGQSRSLSSSSSFNAKRSTFPRVKCFSISSTMGWASFSSWPVVYFIIFFPSCCTDSISNSIINFKNSGGILISIIIAHGWLHG